MIDNKVIYAHYNEKGLFYIGLGNIERAYTKSGRGKSWYEHVGNNKYYVQIIEDKLTLLTAQELEADLIDLIGRKINNTGQLINVRLGGNVGGGLSGYKHTDEARLKISQAGIGRFYSKESRKKMSESAKGKCKKYDNNCAKPIFDYNTKRTYKTITEASKHLGIKRTTLNAYLSGQNKNKTNLKYIN